MSRNIMILILVISTTTCSETAKILAVVPMPSMSHQIVFRHLIHELHKRGHEIVIITPDPLYPKGHTPKNLTEIDVHNISYSVWHNFITTFKLDDYDHAEAIVSAIEVTSRIFEEQIKTEEVQSILNNENENFDLIITEQWVRPTIAFSYRFNIPVIAMNSFGGMSGLFESIGAEAHPLLYPLPTQQRINNLSMREKIHELYTAFSIQRGLKTLEEKDNQMLKTLFGPNIPSITELDKNIDMVFLNAHAIWESNRPIPPNVIYLGGLQLKAEEKLPKDLQTYLDSSESGVIYISFGTNVRPSLLDLEKMKMLMKVLSRLPYKIVWKWDTDESPTEYKNIKFSKWFPQSDLLRHPNVKLFITQGGLQSTDESIVAGVPLIGFPIIADQFYNSEKYVQHGIGVHLNLQTVTEEEFHTAIETVINDNSYRKNIIKLRAAMYDHPQTSLERAVWWTEYVLRHKGAKHLRAAGFQIHWTQYYEIQLIFTIIFIFIFIIFTIFMLIQYIRQILYRKIKIN